MSALTPIAARLGQYIKLLASDRDGEVLACVAAMKRTLSGQGLDLHDLAKSIAEPNSTSFADLMADVLRRQETPPNPTRTKPPAEVPPLFERLKRSARLEWLDHAAASDLLDDAERGLIVLLRAQVYSQPHKIVAPKQCAAISAALGKLWLAGVRV